MNELHKEIWWVGYRTVLQLGCGGSDITLFFNTHRTLYKMEQTLLYMIFKINF